MNVCIVGHGMMGEWHSNALATSHACRLHTLVGRREEPTEQFARRYGYLRWTTDLAEALDDVEVDAVIVASPSEQHAEAALAALRHGKHVLVEIPLALSVADADRVVRTAEERGLVLGVVHPLRARPELRAIWERQADGVEEVRHVAGRFFVHRLENVGATGYRRSWTDNLLWHHMAHLVDAGVWLFPDPVQRVEGVLPPPDPTTGTPMETAIVVESTSERSLVCTGSYYGRERIFEVLVITDRDSYRLDVFRDTLVSSAGSCRIAAEEETCGVVALDFVEAVREGRESLIPGRAVLPALHVLQGIQDAWDKRHGARAIPGRPLRLSESAAESSEEAARAAPDERL